MSRHSDTPQQQLAQLLRTKREALGISGRELARRAGLDNGTVARLERAVITQPTAESLTAIARVLSIPVVDIFTIAKWLPRNQLPTFRPYLRARYPNMPESALADIEAYAEKITCQYDASADGPAEGEDELPE